MSRLGSVSAETSHTADPRSKGVRPAVTAYIPEIDSLRALAMTMVIAQHCGLLPFGWMGVWLFFVISGFAVTTSILGTRSRRRGWGALARGFYLRRCRRIWPVYFLYLLLAAVFLVLSGRTAALESIPYLSTFTFNLRMIFRGTADGAWGGFEHLWTLSVEQTFYVFFPLIFLLPTRRAMGWALLGLVVAGPLVRWGWSAWISSLGWSPIDHAFAVYAFAPAHFDAFALGALIALFRAEIAMRRDWMGMAFLAAAAVSLAYVGYYGWLGIIRVGHLAPEALRNIVSGILYGQGREVFVYLVPTALGAAVLMALVCGEPVSRRLCASSAVQAVGRISYGGYLFHVAVIIALMNFIPAFQGASVATRLLLFTCTMAGTIVVATISYAGFEQRFLRARRRVPTGTAAAEQSRHFGAAPPVASEKT